MKLKKGDIIIVFIFIIALFSWFILNKPQADMAGKQIVIQVDGQVYKKISFESIVNKEILQLESVDGKYMDIVIDSKGVRVENVMCPDKVCEKTGVINKVGQSIVCLPNRVVISIEGNELPQVDGVAY